MRTSELLKRFEAGEKSWVINELWNEELKDIVGYVKSTNDKFGETEEIPDFIKLIDGISDFILKNRYQQDKWLPACRRVLEIYKKECEDKKPRGSYIVEESTSSMSDEEVEQDCKLAFKEVYGESMPVGDCECFAVMPSQEEIEKAIVEDAKREAEKWEAIDKNDLAEEKNAAKEFRDASFKYLNTIANGGVCSDSSCLRCRIASNAFEVSEKHSLEP